MTTTTFLHNVYEIRAWFKTYKKTCRCSHCGKTENIEFHHIGKKKMKVAAMVRKATTLKDLQDEIRECIPLCNTCHKAEHKRLSHDN